MKMIASTAKSIVLLLLVFANVAVCAAEQETSEYVLNPDFNESSNTVLDLQESSFPYVQSELGQICDGNHRCLQMHSECSWRTRPPRCKCKEYYEEIQFKNRTHCFYVNKHAKDNRMYKVVMMALACFMFAVLATFILFLCHRSFAQSRNRCCSNPENSEATAEEDIFSICDQLAQAQFEVNKPPTYEDVVIADRQILGVPPPPYSANKQESARSRRTACNNLAYIEEEQETLPSSTQMLPVT